MCLSPFFNLLGSHFRTLSGFGIRNRLEIEAGSAGRPLSFDHFARNGGARVPDAPVG